MSLSTQDAPQRGRPRQRDAGWFPLRGLCLPGSRSGRGRDSPRHPFVGGGVRGRSDRDLVDFVVLRPACVGRAPVCVSRPPFHDFRVCAHGATISVIRIHVGRSDIWDGRGNPRGCPVSPHGGRHKACATGGVLLTLRSCRRSDWASSGASPVAPHRWRTIGSKRIRTAASSTVTIAPSRSGASTWAQDSSSLPSSALGGCCVP